MFGKKEINLLEPAVPLPALPARDKVKQVNALRGLAVGLARLARQLDRQARKNRQPCALVALPHQRRVKVDLGSQRRDRQKTCRPDGHERCYCLVEEARVHVRCLLQNDDVAPGPFGRAYLQTSGLANMQKIQSCCLCVARGHT